ncbi:hypothetical protein H9P43_006198 [Blastocladiella emersonii ATCC 22665]|nr:hypothetical protein H9P43_006198 [Blastocladiella emersonii ATCC 22665]
MFCSISGQPCAEPVVSRTGYVFERRLIEQALASNGSVCPVSGEPLTRDDLFAVKQPPAGSDTPSSVAVAPKPASATSIPSLLRSLQAEWDAAMLETHALKVQNAQVRQELSRALYQHDAACRVVARLMAEKDTLKLEIDALKRQIRTGAVPAAAPVAAAPAASVSDAMDVDAAVAAPASPTAAPAAALPADVVADFEATNERLSKTRKKRKTPETATADDLAAFTPSTVLESSYAGLASLAVVTPNPATDAPTLLAIAGKSRGTATVDWASKQLAGHLPGQLKASKVSSLVVLSHDTDTPVFAGAVKDHVIVATHAEVSLNIQTPAPVVALAAHPSGNYLFVATAEPAVHLYAAAADGALVATLTPPAAIRDIAVHPDGILLAAALVSGETLVYNVVELEVVATLAADAADAAVLAFSENGFHLAAANASDVQIWDLRKLEVAATLAAPADVRALAFDYTGNYLAVGTAEAHLAAFAYAAKKWTKVAESAVTGAGAITKVAWTAHARGVVAVSDAAKQVILWAAPQ